jgi:hypothetical protein
VVGARASELPIALSRVSERDPAKPELAGTPRGLPTLIQVNKKDGPERSLEEAFKKIQGEDVIIEITDSETYKPIRNYGIDSKNGVLFSESATHVSIRAATDATPKIILSGIDQIGTIPDLSRWFAAPTPQLFLFCMICRSLELDGLTIEMDIGGIFQHSVVATNAQTLRVINCAVVDRETESGHAIYLSRNGYFVVTGEQKGIVVPGANVYWIENTVIDHKIPLRKLGPGEILDVHTSTAFSFTPVGGISYHLLFRNTVIMENLVAINSSMLGWFTMENMTILGRFLCVHSGLRTIEIKDSVFLASFDPIIANPPEALNTINVIGGNNAVWAMNIGITEANRSEGFLRWLPGPVMKGNPEWDSNNFQLKKTRKNTGLSEEDGPVGFRADRIDNFESILKNMEKNKRGK